MNVKTVCLGMLTRGSASGYDLKKYFESSFGHFFAAGYGSIYPALAALAEQGLVLCEEVAQEGKPDRKVYSITAAGRDHLERALANSEPSHKVRSEFLAMLFFAHLMADERINAVLDHRLRECDALLDSIDAFERETVESMPDGARFVAGFGRAVAEACKRYVEENRDMLVKADAGTLKSAHG